MISRLYTLFITLIVLFSFNTSITLAGVNYFDNESTASLLLSYFDLRQRSTHVQVTNTDSVNPVTIHVQIFADLNNCVDRDFTDTLTPNETHVYDISNLVSANGNPINFVIPDGSHGFVLISSGDGMGNDVEQIIGNFRIVDIVGYEYRVNSAGVDGPANDCSDRVGRFSMQWGANQADFIGVDIDDIDNFLPDGTRDVTVDIPDITENELFVFDDEETGTSCGTITVGCDETPGLDNGDPDMNEPQEFTADFINQGINDSFPNSRGGGVLCDGDFNTEGYFLITTIESGGEFFGFYGLNNGTNRGSMDRLKIINEGSTCPDE